MAIGTVMHHFGMQPSLPEQDLQYGHMRQVVHVRDLEMFTREATLASQAVKEISNPVALIQFLAAAISCQDEFSAVGIAVHAGDILSPCLSGLLANEFDVSGCAMSGTGLVIN